jgi:hypothetical protein
MTQDDIDLIRTVLRLNGGEMKFSDFIKAFPYITANEIFHLNSIMETITNGVITPGHGKFRHNFLAGQIMLGDKDKLELQRIQRIRQK